MPRSVTRITPPRLVLASLASAILLAACGGGSDAGGPAAPIQVSLAKIGQYQHLGGPSAAEISAFDPRSDRLFVVNGALGSVDVLDLGNPASPQLIDTLDALDLGAGLGAANSVAVYNGVVAVALQATVKTDPGSVVFLRASDLAVLATVTVGALPDMLTFTPDGRALVVANEGEPNSYNQPDSVDPVGSVSIIRVTGISPATSAITTQVQTAGFATFDSQLDSLRAAGVRIYGPNASVSQDLEPEYLTISSDSRTAWATLQENNAIAEIDLASATVTRVRSLGSKDHNVAGAGMDVSDEDGVSNSNSGTPAIRIAPVPVRGLYLPDAVASYRVNGVNYLITANEGDAREYVGINADGREDLRVRGYCGALDPLVFGDAGNQILDSNLGRLRITAIPNGGLNSKNGSGQCNQLFSLGSRSFSIWNADSLIQVYDSGDEFEQRTTTLPNVMFNASNDDNALDSRSASKGPEPEGVVLGTVRGRTLAFIGLERVGGIMVYDVTDPASPRFLSYANPRTGATGDRGPEGLTFISATNSPTGLPLLVVGNETSGTTAVLQISASSL